MKKLVLILIFPALFFKPAAAQEYSPPPENYFEMGLFFGFKAGVNGNYIPEGRQNAIAFGAVPDFGARVFYPLNETADLGASLDLSYSTYMYGVKNFATGEKYDHKYSYIAVSPKFHFFEGFAGFNFGLPVSAGFGEEIDKDNINVLVEFRMGAEFQILGDRDGKVNVFAIAGYMLNGIYDDFAEQDPLRNIIPVTDETEPVTNKFNPRALTLTIGFSYMFTIEL